MILRIICVKKKVLIRINQSLVLLKRNTQEIPCTSINMTETNKVVRLNTNDLSTHLELGLKTLMKGGVVALPTDTIYGLAALSQDCQAIQRIYDIKGRDHCKPLAVAISSVKHIHKWVKVTISEDLLEELFQGAVTLVFKRLPSLNPSLNPSTPLVGIRVPSETFLLSLADQCPCPLALTSANKSSFESALAVQEFQSIWPSIDVVFDGGSISSKNFSKAGSTVVDLSKPGFFHIIRDGCALERTLGVLKKHGLEESKEE